MSKASDLRDAVRDELQSRFTEYSVDSFVLPRYERSELADGPRIVVRNAVRSVSMDEGPDVTTVAIQIGVIGLVTTSSGNSPSERRQSECDKADALDELFESLISLWMNDGDLANVGISEHWPVEVEQEIQFDSTLLDTEGIYLSIFRVNFQDSRE